MNEPSKVCQQLEQTLKLVIKLPFPASHASRSRERSCGRFPHLALSRYSMVFLYCVFVIVANITILNMLIGVLCEIVAGLRVARLLLS